MFTILNAIMGFFGLGRKFKKHDPGPDPVLFDSFDRIPYIPNTGMLYSGRPSYSKSEEERPSDNISFSVPGIDYGYDYTPSYDSESSNTSSSDSGSSFDGGDSFDFGGGDGGGGGATGDW